MITRQGAEIVPIPFDQLMDPKTHKTRVRLVDVETGSHGSARALQVRIEPDDLANEQRLARLAEAAKLTPEQARERWADAVAVR
jgi:6-phosphofructokinase 1